MVGLDGDVAPLYQGTVARIEENGLAGIASHYVTLQPATKGNAQIPSGGTIPQSDTYAEVALDQIFDTLNAQTREGLRNIIRGEATSIRGKALQANRTLEYLDPLLQSTSQVTGALTRDEPAFDQLLVQGAQTMQRLASSSQQLTDLVGKADAVTGAVARQSHALDEALALLPSALSKSTKTFAGLRSTIAALEPLVAATKPQVKQLEPFAVALDRFATAATPDPRLPRVADLQPQGREPHRAPAGGADARTRGELGLPRDHRVDRSADVLGSDPVVARVHARHRRRAGEHGPAQRLLRRQRPLRARRAVLRCLRHQRRHADRPIAGRPLQRA